MGNVQSEFVITGVPDELSRDICWAAKKGWGGMKIKTGLYNYTDESMGMIIKSLQSYGFTANINRNEFAILWDRKSVHPGNPYLYICNLSYENSEDSKRKGLMYVQKLSNHIERIIKKKRKKDPDIMFKNIYLEWDDIKNRKKYCKYVVDPKFRQLLNDKCSYFNYKVCWDNEDKILCSSLPYLSPLYDNFVL